MTDHAVVRCVLLRSGRAASNLPPVPFFERLNMNMKIKIPDVKLNIFGLMVHDHADVGHRIVVSMLTDQLVQPDDLPAAPRSQIITDVRQALKSREFDVPD